MAIRLSWIRIFGWAEASRAVAVIGWDVKDELFPTVDPIGRMVSVQGKPFRVVGMLARQGRAFGQSQDNVVVMPLGAFHKAFGRNQTVDIMVEAPSSAERPAVEDEVRLSLRARRGARFADPDPFGIVTAEALQAFWRQFTFSAFALVIVISSISLVVGGVAIANTMFATIVERTREIGLRKALGARRRDLRRQFLVEAVSLSLAGGLLGVGLGFAVSRAIAAFNASPDALPQGAGGILGRALSDGMVRSFGAIGATLLGLALFLGGVTGCTGLSWLALMDRTGQLTLLAWEKLRNRWQRMQQTVETERKREERVELVEVKTAERKARPKPKIEPAVPKVETSPRVEREKQVPLFELPNAGGLPPLALLDDAPERKQGYSEEALEAMSRLVELKLKDFGIEVQVVAVHPGPVITRFELQPAAGVKSSQISNLAKDLARALSAHHFAAIGPGEEGDWLRFPPGGRGKTVPDPLAVTARRLASAYRLTPGGRAKRLAATGQRPAPTTSRRSARARKGTGSVFRREAAGRRCLSPSR